MKTLKKLNSVNAAFLVLLVVAAATVSCRKKADTIAIITVQDIDQNAVDNAMVILKGAPSSAEYANKEIIIDDTVFTDEFGKARFNYNETYQLGQAGVAVLDIVAIKDTLVGTGIIKIEEETTNEETVIVQPL